jgi:cysteinyl-tRNA synthetase
MALHVFNTLTRQKEEFKPIESGKVRFYHCGPTVYWTQHIGNLRGMTMADLIRRSLQYLGYDVTFVRNYTDVGHLTSDADQGEDKMEKGAKREGLSPREIADKYIKIFEDDCAALNIIPPDHKPRATDCIPEIVAMIQTLLDKEYAYVTELAVYFDISKFPGYTQLSRRKLEEDIEGAGKADVTDPKKRHTADFAMWFFRRGKHEHAIQYWPSPFTQTGMSEGQGFPGWHIECSAMTKKFLGDTIDFHMGGIEHISVHHTNEIAQSEAANGVKFVDYWLHNEHLMVERGKMAKSQGTGYALSEVIEKGFDPLALRYLFLGAHYRSKQNFTWEGLQGAQTAWNKLRETVGTDSTAGNIAAEFKAQFRAALEDDFNIPQALAVAWEVAKSDLSLLYKRETLLDFDRVLGLNLGEPVASVEISGDERQAIEGLIAQRTTARQEKKFAEADRLRDKLKDTYHVEIEDTAEGTKWKKR